MHPIDADYSKEHQQHAEEEKNKEPAAEKDSEGRNLTGATHADSKQASHVEGTGPATEHDRQPSSPTPGPCCIRAILAGVSGGAAQAETINIIPRHLPRLPPLPASLPASRPPALAAAAAGAGQITASILISQVL